MNPKKATKAGETSVRNVGWTIEVNAKTNTACKHGAGDCEVCGTTNYSDKKHTTVGGKGLVARLRERK